MTSIYLCGYDTYAEYLSSRLWYSIRARKLRECPNCELCSCRAQQVHHFSYGEGVMRGWNAKQLVSVCRDCHEEIEFSGARKLSLEHAQKRLVSMLKRRGKLGRAEELQNTIHIKDTSSVIHSKRLKSSECRIFKRSGIGMGWTKGPNSKTKRTTSKPLKAAAPYKGPSRKKLKKKSSIPPIANWNKTVRLDP